MQKKWIFAACSACLFVTINVGEAIARKEALMVNHPGVDVLSFMAGHWQSKMDSAHVKDMWINQTEECIVGVMRSSDARAQPPTGRPPDKRHEYQLLVIESTPFSPIMTIRQFQSLLDLPESKDPRMLGLDSYDKNKAVFTDEREEDLLRITYTKLGNLLTVTSEQTIDGKKIERTCEFRHLPR